MSARNGNKKNPTRIARKKSRVLYQITALLIIILVAFFLMFILLYRSSLDRLTEKSEEKVIQTEGENFSTSFGYIAGLINENLDKDLEQMSFEDIYEEFDQALTDQEITDIQRLVNEKLKGVVDSGVLGLEAAIMVVFPEGILSGLMDAPLVIFSSDDNLLFFREIPEHWNQTAKEGRTYLLMKEGIPDFGLDGEYLITLAPYREKRTGVEMLSVGIKPVQKELAEISEFFNSEKKNINLLMLLVIAGSVIVIILMTFLVLSHLIRRNITEPVEQLAVAAGEIMEGNLDVEIEVHQGGEFEGLEQAFKEMLESLRRMIERSVGE